MCTWLKKKKPANKENSGHHRWSLSENLTKFIEELILILLISSKKYINRKHSQIPFKRPALPWLKSKPRTLQKKKKMKLQTNVPDEHGCKGHQIISKLNLTEYQKDYVLWPYIPEMQRQLNSYNSIYGLFHINRTKVKKSCYYLNIFTKNLRKVNTLSW